ncbi:MAG: glycine--tRNA ligase subunit beta [Mariprofundales bacterium]
MINTSLLLEIGVEELPAASAPRLATAFSTTVCALLDKAKLDYSDVHLGVTPRRILLHIKQCSTRQNDDRQTLWGPPAAIAKQKDGQWSKAAIGFARKLGLQTDDLSLINRDNKGKQYVQVTRQVIGRDTVAILAEELPNIIRKLPSPKQMRWSDGLARNDAFLRPIRWLVARLGNDIIPFSYAGIATGLQSRGHRVHGSTGELCINNPFQWLESQYVIANRCTRKKHIIEQLNSACQKRKVRLITDNDLLDEVTDLVEWPQVVASSYNENYLRLPTEVSRIVLKHHQRCFASCAENGEASHIFFTVANISSSNPQVVATGNARVVNARLADAAFYFDRDPKTALDVRVEQLNQIVFQEGLGTVGDQITRLRACVLDLAPAFGADSATAQRAAYLCKSDLTTGLVGEFPELQGYIGSVYANMQDEPQPVATAIAQHYLPAGMQDDLPSSIEARLLGIVERLDKLLGYFHIGSVPSSSADPYALRRAAITLLRLLADTTCQLSLSALLDISAKQWNQQRITIGISSQTKKQVLHFIHERLLGMDNIFTISRSAMDAAIHSSMARDISGILAVAKLVQGFSDSEAGQAVMAANKRVANILKKAKLTDIGTINRNLLTADAEIILYQAMQDIDKQIYENSSQTKAAACILQELASLRGVVDDFFDQVMVMVEDKDIRQNRLLLLHTLRQMFLQLADFSR